MRWSGFFPGKRRLILTGMMQDKDTEKMLEQMAEHAACFVCLHPDSPRALSAEQLAQQVTERFGLPAFCCESIAQGVALARGKSRQRRTGVCAGVAVSCR